MASLTLYPEDERLSGSARTAFNLYMVTAILLFVVIMSVGLTMRLSQATWLKVAPNLFYELLSLHGAGMIGTMSLASTAAMWFFVRKYVQLRMWAFVTNYVLFMLGVVSILLSIFIGHYGALWTFLYPLPVQGMGLWTPQWSALFMLGYLFIGVGQLLFYLDVARGMTARFGNLARAMGMQWLFGGTVDPDHPKAIVAGAGVLIANSIGIVVGSVALVMSLVNVFYPEVKLNPLVIKNLIYWFGHMYANATMYMAVITVYELLPRYTQKPYHIGRPFLWAWLVTALYVIVVFPHHLLMDYAQPRWVSVMGQVASWVGGFPVFLVTAFGALNNLHHSRIRWNMPARLLVLSMFGFAAGVVPAILDGTIRVNLVMHNTQWVPGHFHFYMLLGTMAMVLALMYHVVGSLKWTPPNSGMDRLGFPVFFIGGLIFVFGFLAGGHASVPRRMAQHMVEAWTVSDKFGAVGGSLVVLAMLYFALRLVTGLLAVPAPAPTAGQGHVATADAAG
ncbi:MAG: cbb3-type cytochrome c oxidase subunit I [Thermomonas sp.]|uniref:cbb3-type cytochrome c oxidase subunit I n=1 Tax=Thermomonas sp. TaxID=1971895 RepID=UPI001DFE5061|nr:cbb3-type cytochrome c oxidase subunit I [Thermomonas sp.]MBZ0087692.1 cbb3-type cytochrome c oxidase subunit I [Thermomonas sp.]